MIFSIGYWAILGTIYLGLLTYQDFKDNMLVDERRNYFMFGVTISLLSHVNRSFFYIVSVALLVSVFFYFGRKFKGFGEADIQAFSWIFFGFGILNPLFLGFYILILSFFTVIYLFFKIKVFKISKPTPFFAIIFLSFFVNCIFSGMYW